MAEAKKPAPSRKDESPEARQKALREALTNKREELLSEARVEIAKYSKGENRDGSGASLDDGDLSVIDHSEGVALQMLGAHRDTLLKIDESLRKLDEGTYGVCEDCGDPISTERLSVLPFAICCRDCQELREETEAIEKLEQM